MNIQTKICTLCNNDLPITDFHKCSHKQYGVASRCKSCCSKLAKERRSKLTDEDKKNINKYKKQYRLDNKEKDKQHYLDNREEIYAKKKAYILSKKEYFKEYGRLRRLERRNTDPLYKFRVSVGTLIRNSFKRQYTIKSKKTLEILGCTYDKFIIHIESKFDENMNWTNHGSYWHIDHIKPISLAKTTEEVIELNHYTNLQPLEAKENLRKGNKY